MRFYLVINGIKIPMEFKEEHNINAVANDFVLNSKVEIQTMDEFGKVTKSLYVKKETETK